MTEYEKINEQIRRENAKLTSLLKQVSEVRQKLGSLHNQREKLGQKIKKAKS